MNTITCQFCGDTYPGFDVAHVCSKGPYAYKMPTPSVSPDVLKMWADPRFQILSEVDKLLTASKMWDGMNWTYHSIHPIKYRPVSEKVRRALYDLQIEYGVDE